MADGYTAYQGWTLMATADENWGVVLDAILSLIDGLGAVGPLGVQTTEHPTSASLNVKVSAGSYRKSDGTTVNYGGTTSQAVTASSTNYIYLTDAGILTVNTTGFPSATNIVPMATVVAGSATITSIADSRLPWHSFGAQSELYSTQTANYVLAGPASGSAAAPTFRALVSADIPTTLTHAWISDFVSTVESVRLDQMATPGAAVAWGGYGITGLANPVNPQDAATKAYVDLAAQGLSQKPTATVATTTTLPSNTYANGSSGVGATLTATANGVLTVDGHAVALGDDVLVKNEAAAANNGLYTCTTAGASGAAYVLTRALQMETSAEFLGSFVPVGPVGSTLDNTLWLCSNTSAITIGATSIGFTQFGAGSGTVTSVTVTGDNVIFASSVSGSPITTSGTINLASSLKTQTANYGLMGPTTGSAAAPTFRALVAADVPSLPASQITSGQLACARGGTGVDTSSAANGKLLIGNGSGLSLATLTAGSNITITNSAGGITIASSGGGSSATYATASSSTYSCLSTDAIVFVTCSSATTITLPTSGVSTGYQVLIVDDYGTGRASNPITISTGTSAPLDGTYGGGYQITQNYGAALVSLDASGHWVSQPQPASGSLTIGTTSVASGTSGYILYDNAGTLGAEQYVPTANGGTGVNSSSAADGALLIGTGSGLSLATISAGQGILVTNSSGGITIGRTPLYTQTYGSTTTFNLLNSDLQIVTLTGDPTLALSNVTVGLPFTIGLKQDSTGSRTVTWFGATINWSGGSTPTLTTTANKTDWFTFICVSSGVFDGGPALPNC